MDDVEAFRASLQSSKRLQDSETSSYACTLSPRQSLHFTLSCSSSSPDPSVSSSSPNPKTTHAFLTLPPSLFVDPYELSQRYTDSDGPLVHIWGETDLELPIASERIDTRGSALLITLNGDGDGDDKWKEGFSVPVHARYLMPDTGEEGNVEKGRRTHQSVNVDAPVFFVSDVSLTSLRIPPNSTIHLLPYTSSSSSGLSVDIPIGDTQHLAFVEPLTVVSIVLCFFYLGRSLVRWSQGGGSVRMEGKKKAE